MKKMTLLLVLLIAFYSCKEKNAVKDEKEIVSKDTVRVDSITKRLINDIHSLTCKYNDYSLLESYHKLTDEEKTIIILKDYWGVIANVKHKSIPWETIQKMIDKVSCSEQYLSFTYDSNTSVTKVDDIQPLLRNYHDENITCFSIPFLRSVKQNNNVANKMIEFTKGKENGRVVILFRIEGTNEYYDISLDPTKKSIKKL